MSHGHGGHDDHGHGGHGSGWTVSVELVVLILVILALAYWVPLSSEKRRQQMLTAAETPVAAPTVVSPFGMVRGGFGSGSTAPLPGAAVGSPPAPSGSSVPGLGALSQPPVSPAPVQVAPPVAPPAPAARVGSLKAEDAMGSSCLVFGTIAAGLAYYTGPGYIAAMVATGSLIPAGPAAALSTGGAFSIVGSAFLVGCAVGAAVGPTLGSVVSGQRLGSRETFQAAVPADTVAARALTAANWEVYGSEATLSWLDQDMLARTPFAPVVGPAVGAAGAVGEQPVPAGASIATVGAFGPQTVAGRH